MKMVVAVVRDFMGQRVVDALHAVSAVSGATITEVRGFGRGRRRGDPGLVEEDLLGTTPHTRVEVVVRDELVGTVVAAIQTSAHTGNRGDGKIFVLPVERALRLSSGEQGEAAL